MVLPRVPLIAIAAALPCILFATGCVLEQQAVTQPTGDPSSEISPPLVDVAVVSLTDQADGQSYTGTTAPLKQVSVRSQVEGQLLNLTADVGDPVSRGELLAQLDNRLLLTEVNETQAELVARQFEVEQAKSELQQTHALVKQTEAQLKQAKADANRLKSLADQGAISVQDAEVAETSLQTTQQALNSIQAQIITREQAIATEQSRVMAQKAIMQQALERATYATLIAPLTGVVFSKAVESGDLVQPGQVLLEIGDLSQIKIEIQVSDRDFSQFALAQAVQVSLDAFPNESFPGKVTRISPVADAAARLIPIEVTIPNPNYKITSGLLARVTPGQAKLQTVTIPESALQIAADSKPAVVFIPLSDGAETLVEARPVKVGQTSNSQVEILSGLKPGERFIVQSDRPLEAGQTVRRSLLSD